MPEVCSLSWLSCEHVIWFRVKLVCFPAGSTQETRLGSRELTLEELFSVGEVASQFVVEEFKSTEHDAWELVV